MNVILVICNNLKNYDISKIFYNKQCLSTFIKSLIIGK